MNAFIKLYFCENEEEPKNFYLDHPNSMVYAFPVLKLFASVKIKNFN